MKEIKISIITVSFNAEKTIEDTIKSVISQKREGVEYIIIDGGSKDNTLNIINKYNNQIDFFVSERDNGISDAFNKGIEYAKGKIIGIINADDMLHEGAINALWDCIEEDIDIYRGNIIVWNDETGEKKKICPTMDLYPHGQKIVIAHPGTFVSKKAYEKYGKYDVNCKIKMDYDLLIRMAKNGVRMKYVDANMAVFRNGGVSTNKKNLLKSTKKSIRETRYILKKNKIGIYVFFVDVARILCKRVVCIFTKE